MQQSGSGPGAEQDTGPFQRLLGSLRGLIATVLAIGRTRLELLTVEVHLEIRRIADLLVLAMVALYAASAGLLMTGFAIVLAFWDTHRVLAAMLVAAGFLLVSVAAALTAWRRWRAAPGFLAGSLGELARDVEQLRGGR